MNKKYVLKKIMSTLLAFLIVLGMVSMESGVAFAEENNDDAITVTIHFSSVDGDDLMDPIKITNVAPGTTLEEAVSAAIKDEVVPKTFFDMEGYRFWSSFTPKPLSYYASLPLETWWDEMYADRNAADATELYEDKDFYAHMYKYVDTPIFVTVDAPKCGVETTTHANPNPEGDYDKYDWESQTNLPVMSFTDSSKEILDLYSTWARWINEEEFVASESYVPFNGKFVGGEKYYIDITFDPKPGLLFSEKCIEDSEIEVSGDVDFDIVDSFYMPFMTGLTIVVPAEHVPGEWKVTKEPTATEEGEETRICTGCHKEEKRLIQSKDSEKKDDDNASDANEGDSNKSNTSIKTSSAAPETGDENHPWLYAGLILLSLMIIVLYTKFFSRCNSKKNNG